MYINCFENSLQLHFYADIILSCCNQSLLQIFQVLYCFQSATNIKPDDILQFVVENKMEMVALLFKWVLLIIRFFICIKKVPLFLFQKHLNVTIMGNVLTFMV